MATRERTDVLRLLVMGSALLGALVSAPARAADEAGAPPSDPLAALGFAVTGGAAPGYIEDHACSLCHRELWSSYQEVGMARSMRRASAENVIETFPEEPYVHAESNRHYRMSLEEGGYVFRRWVLDEAGNRAHELVQPVDWILGSGNHTRTYLYRTPSGELFQLPLAWYSQTGRWAMAPGFEIADHQGVGRRVRRECMFCHNAYPDVPEGSDAYGSPQLFPAELPEGTGCQRCHGPGAEHVRRAFATAPPAELRDAIVNPGRLAPELRDGICYGCHLQPSVLLPGIRRFGRPDYSFRPGEPIADYLVHVDVEEEGRGVGERFEINHHPYRLRQSRCYKASAVRPAGETLSCLTCHDPHRKVPATERAAHYRAACQSCHEADACGREHAAGAHDASDCVACHMPERRTEDVVEVTMTDHFIRRAKPERDLTAPLPPSDPVATRLLPYFDLEPQAAGLWPLYHDAGLVRTVPKPDLVEQLRRKLQTLDPRLPAPWLDLARGLVRNRRYEEALAAAGRARELGVESPLVDELSALAENGLGRRADAAARLRDQAERFPARAETHFNLGILLAPGDESVAALERALELRPHFVAAWSYLGYHLERLGRSEKARDAYERALAADPDEARAQRGLERLAATRRERGASEAGRASARER